ncbi:hypothetical protein ABIC83_002911 [Roseateles asaccharophilus]|uniref:hypothetical protein n=1 Tax=Roseateles asaccharophilus TaxID=582607 RepID=UPI003835A9EB
MLLTAINHHRGDSAYYDVQASRCDMFAVRSGTEGARQGRLLDAAKAGEAAALILFGNIPFPAPRRGR